METTKKKLLLAIGLLTAVIIVVIAYLNLDQHHHSESQPILTGTEATSTNTCAEPILAQEQALNNDPLADTVTFNKYPVATILQTTPANLDTASNPFAYEFRSVLEDQLAKAGVNFAGHYSIASVGLTGFGDNYFIIDRTNGKAYLFPYEATFMDFKKNSNLILMNSKADILAYIKENGSGSCESTGAGNLYYTDARPFYLLWQDNKLHVLGSSSSTPPINPFWTSYNSGN